MATRAIARRAPRRVYLRRRSSKRSFTLPLAAIAGFVPVLNGTVQKSREHGFTGHDGGLSFATRSLTGYNYDEGVGPVGFYWSHLRSGAVPILAGLLVHKAASMLGINRALGRARVPFIRL